MRTSAYPPVRIRSATSAVLAPIPPRHEERAATACLLQRKFSLAGLLAFRRLPQFHLIALRIHDPAKPAEL